VLPISRILIGDALTGQQLKAAIDAGLAKADLLIGYQVAFRRAMEWSASTEMPGPGVYVLEGETVGLRSFHPPNRDNDDNRDPPDR
jgi:hypothetical protein